MAQTVGKKQESTSSSQGKNIYALLSKIDTLLTINNMLLEQIEIDSSLKGRFKLYKTENNFNFLELDTKTGKIKQVQWSLDEKNEGSSVINNVDLSWGTGYGSGSFELYPTSNIFQFILIDKTNGRKWHVQWGLENANRWIRYID
ncbi:hypothetical protein JCM15640A_15810 [Hoylesella timonensis 4401737 = DSM 22865 = JCM 15640]|uniref:hypothetical protein n=1 Tax=Hoylesella timonensis TaxID=386414 RepID=UPI000469DD12|nr:hypothetical protein [Hoylesella timonensis]